VAVSRAESIHLLRGTVRAEVRSRTSVEALQNRQVSNTPGGVIAKAITPLSLLMNALSSSNSFITNYVLMSKMV